MTAEELFCNLYEKYGDDFNWFMPSFIDDTYIKEAKKEIKKGHYLYGKRLYCVFKCKYNNDVIFVTGDNGKDLYIVCHLMYEEGENIAGPQYELLDNIYEVENYLIKSYEGR